MPRSVKKGPFVDLHLQNKVDKANLSAKFDTKNNFIYTKDELNGKKVTTIFSDIAIGNISTSA